MDFVPKVSIVIPVYNGADFLSQAIDSALAQTYSNIEILVVNDGSDDDGATEKIALSYGSRLRYFKKENGGVGSALNTAIDEMSGDYFSWLSHDDLYYPDKIDSQIQALSNMEKHKTILYGNFVFFYEDVNNVKEVLLSGVPPDQFRFFITVKNSIHGCTLLIPKTAFKDCGTFNCELRTTQDFDLWFRMAEKYDFVHIPHLLVKARQHFNQGTIRMHGIVLKECNQLLTDFINKLSEQEITSATSRSVSLSYVDICASMLQRGFFDAAKHASTLAVKSIKKGSMFNAVKTVISLISTKIVYTQVGLLRSSLIWTRVMKPLYNTVTRRKITS